MIESCSKKRMLLGITLLGGLTILVLIIESQWTSSTNSKIFVENVDSNTTCGSKTDDDEVITECHPCNAFELTSKIDTVCAHAKYKEIIRCKSGETITRSCDRVAWLEERAFMKFQGFMFVIAIVSCVSVFWREGILRKRAIRKVAKQLRASV